MLNRLHEAVSAVCPIYGVSGAQGAVEVQFRPEATAGQRAAAQAAVAAFDWSEAAHAAWQEARNPERKTLRDAAVQAVADIDAYLALVSPSNAQVAAQVRRLSQHMRAVVRRLTQLD